MVTLTDVTIFTPTVKCCHFHSLKFAELGDTLFIDEVDISFVQAEYHTSDVIKDISLRDHDVLVYGEIRNCWMEKKT